MEIEKIKKPSDMTTLERIKHFFFLGHEPEGYGGMFYPFRTTGGMIKWIEDLLTIIKQKDEEIESLKSIKNDYDELIKIMDRARKLAFLVDDEDEREEPKFKMDSEGNLTRI